MTGDDITFVAFVAVLVVVALGILGVYVYDLQARVNDIERRKRR